MKTPLIFFAALALAAALPLFGQTDAVEEADDFFDDGAVETETAEKETGVDEALDAESVSFTGTIDAVGSYTLTRDFLWGLADLDDNALSYYLSGDFLLDVRLRKGFKAFVDLSVGYSNVGLPVLHTYNLMSPVLVYDYPVPGLPNRMILPGTLLLVSENQDMVIGIKELFVDFNIDNAVYFRVGKQVLQWGRGYLWNPTDLVNIEKKSFLDVEALRDGTFGLRTDFVFSRHFHFFTFVQFQGAEDFSDMAVAGKAEFLIGQAEMSLSAWWKGGKIPVFGYDISLPLFWEIDFRAEASLSWGDNLDKMRTDGSPYSLREQLIPRVSAGFSRAFDVADVEDRLIVNAEFYYNHAGYDENMFESLSAANRAVFLGGYYDSGNYGKFYGALFLTIQKFLISQLTLTLSGIGNFSDLSFLAAADFSYAPVYNFTISLRLLAYLGANLREYTFAPDYADLTAEPGNNMFGASISCNVRF